MCIKKSSDNLNAELYVQWVISFQFKIRGKEYSLDASNEAIRMTVLRPGMPGAPFIPFTPVIPLGPFIPTQPRSPLGPAVPGGPSRPKEQHKNQMEVSRLLLQ